jgi:hypothetical protein
MHTFSAVIDRCPVSGLLVVPGVNYVGGRAYLIVAVHGGLLRRLPRGSEPGENP